MNLYFYYSLKGKLKGKLWWLKFRIETSLWFIKLAWLGIRGKIIIIDSREVYSNGGFKYLQVNISERPVNKNANYSKLKKVL